MVETQRIESDRPIRVVMFGGGPVLEHGVQRFIARLEEHPDIDFLAAFCQSEGQSYPAVFRDLWRRRRFLAFPLFMVLTARSVGRFVRQPRKAYQLRKTVWQLMDRIFFVPDIHDPRVLAHVKALEPDLGLIYGSPILRPPLFELPRFGTLGIHHGKVPEYRGKKTTFWAMYNGEATAGVTIQKVNAGLDTGEIVKEGVVEIGERSLPAVWNELETLGLNLYIEAILEVKEGVATYRPQGGEKGKLYRDPAMNDILAFWWHRTRQRLRRPMALTQ